MNTLFVILFFFYSDFAVWPSTTIKIKALPASYDNVLGYCEPEEDLVVLNKIHWDRFSYSQRRELVYHELGHCELGLYHKDSGGIMAPYGLKTYANGSNWGALVAELKHYYENATDEQRIQKER